MPEHACRDRSPRAPRPGDTTDAIGARQRAHSLDLADGRDKREVARWPDVGAAKRHQQVNVRGPRADPAELDERGSGLVVVQRRDRGGIELTGDDRPRDVADVSALLAREPGAS